MIKVKINSGLRGLPLISLDKLKILQGDLKDLTQKNYLRLKKQILKNGFTSPFHIWLNEGEFFLLDGTQRFRTLRQMQEENILIPRLPYLKIEADSQKEALTILLGLASNYGISSAEGLDEMLSLAEIELTESDELFNFPGLDVMNEEKPKEEKEPKPCPKCGYIKNKTQGGS